MTPYRRLVAEALGSFLLVAAIVGSGIMAARLSLGNEALALLCNAVATGAMLAVLISIFGPVSGAHFNPVVTLAFALDGAFAWRDAAPYVLAQVCGAIAGTVIAHLMFDLAPLTIGNHPRTGVAQWLSESVATFALVLTIFGARRHAPAAAAWLVALVIVSAYWFTASTSFANPAVALARGFTQTFAGIDLADVPAFVVAEVVGGWAGWLTGRMLFPGVAAIPGAGGRDGAGLPRV